MARRYVAIALVALTLLGTWAGALPSLATPPLTHVIVSGAHSAGVGAPFFLAGIVTMQPAGVSTAAPMPSQSLAISADGIDIAWVTTGTDGRFSLVAPGIATPGHHAIVAHTDVGPVRTGESDPFDLIVITAPLAPTNLTGGPGRHTGDVVLSWTAPVADVARPVETYLIVRNESGRVSILGQVAGTQTSIGDNRPSGIPLDYRVFAQNGAGRSLPTAWLTVTPALPPPADKMNVTTRTVTACHAGRCETLFPWDFIITGFDSDPVDLSVRFTGRLTNLGTPVDLEPFNGTLNDTYDDRISHGEIAPMPYAAKTSAQGTFDLTIGPLRVPNVRPDQACLRENLTARAHYPGVIVPGGGGPNVLGGDSITVFLC